MGLAALAPGAAGAASVIPTHLPGSSNVDKTCAALGFTELELKADGVNSNPGTYAVSSGGFSVTFTVPSVLDLSVPPPGEKKNSLDFQAAAGTVVYGVIVKNGEDGANLYDYRPAGRTSDLFLTTPFNGAKNISHISACVGPPKAKVTIVKDAVPDDPQNFSYTGAQTLSGVFELDDDGDGTLSNSHTITPTQFGLGTVGETPVDDWDLDSISCVNAQGAAAATIRYGTGSGAGFSSGANGDAFGAGDTTVQIDVQAGVDVTCTFTNKRVGLDVLKIAAATPVDAGDQISFTMLTSNGGPGTARGVTLTDDLPAGVNWTISAQPAGDPCSIAPPGATSGQVLTCSFGDLAAGEARAVTIVATTSVTACATYDNTVTVDATNAPQETSSASIVCRPAAVTVDKTPDGGVVDAGDAVTFTIVTTSEGPGTAKSVTLGDPLPPGLDWSIAAQTNPGECSISGAVGSEVLACDYGDLAALATRSVTVTATTSESACATYDNTATVAATNAPDDTDQGSIACNPASLTVVKTPDGQTVQAGQDVTFSIATTSNGPASATGVTLDDPLPDGLTWSIAAQTNPGECSIQGAGDDQSLVCDYGTLAGGASRSVSVTATTSPTACAAYDNTATVDATNAPATSDAGQVTCAPPPPPPPPPPPAPAASAPAVQQVAPVTPQSAPVVRGTARLRGPSGCVSRPTLRTWVTGRQIQSVRYTLARATSSRKTKAARTLGTIRRPDRLGRWLISIRTKGLRIGTYRVRAVVRFRPESQTRTRTLQRRFRICGGIKPARVRGFTG